MPTPTTSAPSACSRPRAPPRSSPTARKPSACRAFNEFRAPSLYPVAGVTADAEIAEKLALIERANKAARDYDSRITQVRASINDELRRILIAASDGTYASDTQPLARLNVAVIAKDATNTARGTSGGGGRITLDFFEGDKSPEHYAREAARTAILQLGAVAAPAGEMEVVLGPGWPGVLLHEAVGHGLEADFNRKKTSAFAGLIGQQVASSKVTVVDNGRMPGRRGSINVDDEGNATQETVLIENGILRGYLSDKLSSRLMNMPNTGSGRRESYQSIPMPRMTNTYMLNGEDEPGDILKSVKRGLYAVNFGGGPGRHHQRQVCLHSERGVPHRGRHRHRASQGRNPDWQRARSAQVCLDGRQRPGARRRCRHLRQSRPERSRRGWYADHQAGPHDRRRHRALEIFTLELHTGPELPTHAQPQ